MASASVVLVFILAVSWGPTALASTWGYNGDSVKPASWHTLYSTCGTGASAERQSPIALTDSGSTFNSSLPAPQFHLPAGHINFSLSNNGRTVRAQLPNRSFTTTWGGASYVLNHIDFHWPDAATEKRQAAAEKTIRTWPKWTRSFGYMLSQFRHVSAPQRMGLSATAAAAPTEPTGSEHTVDGTQATAEIQFVHYLESFSNYSVAVGASHAVLIVSRLFQTGGSGTASLSALTTALYRVHHGDSAASAEVDVTLSQLLPTGSAEVYAYSGSLTHPPCTEAVQWLVCRSKGSISKTELSALQRLSRSTGHDFAPVAPNYRPVQGANGRTLHRNFELKTSDTPVGLIVGLTIGGVAFSAMAFFVWTRRRVPEVHSHTSLSAVH